MIKNDIIKNNYIEIKEMSEDEVKQNLNVYFANYDASFSDELRKLFIISIPEPYIDYLLSESCLPYFVTAFTHTSADLNNNFLFLKTIGHVSCQKSLVWYLFRKYKSVSQGQKLYTILKNTLSDAKKLGYIINTYFPSLFNYMSIEESYRTNLVIHDDMKDYEKDELTIERNELFQELFEAIFGAVEFLLDQYKQGTGNIIVYDWFVKLFDSYVTIETYGMNMDAMKDPKNKINDLFLTNQPSAGKVEYRSDIDPVRSTELVKRYITELWQTIGSNSFVIGRGQHKVKSVSEKNAAIAALKNIKQKGLVVRSGGANIIIQIPFLQNDSSL